MKGSHSNRLARLSQVISQGTRTFILSSVFLEYQKYHSNFCKHFRTAKLLTMYNQSFHFFFFFGPQMILHNTPEGLQMCILETLASYQLTKTMHHLCWEKKTLHRGTLSLCCIWTYCPFFSSSPYSQPSFSS